MQSDLDLATKKVSFDEDQAKAADRTENSMFADVQDSTQQLKALQVLDTEGTEGKFQEYSLELDEQEQKMKDEANLPI